MQILIIMNILQTLKTYFIYIVIIKKQAMVKFVGKK